MTPIKSIKEAREYLEGARHGIYRKSWEKASEAAADNAHVAAFFYYRSAIEATYDDCSDNLTKAALLYLAIDYAKNLKKLADRVAVAEWGEAVLHPMHSKQDFVDRLFGTQPPEMDLVGIVCKEITKLQLQGDKHAAP